MKNSGSIVFTQLVDIYFYGLLQIRALRCNFLNWKQLNTANAGFDQATMNLSSFAFCTLNMTPDDLLPVL